MTATVADGPRLHTGRQAAALGRRAVVRFARQPSSWVPATVFPLGCPCCDVVTEATKQLPAAVLARYGVGRYR